MYSLQTIRYKLFKKKKKTNYSIIKIAYCHSKASFIVERCLLLQRIAEITAPDSTHSLTNFYICSVWCHLTLMYQQNRILYVLTSLGGKLRESRSLCDLVNVIRSLSIFALSYHFFNEFHRKRNVLRNRKSFG